MVVDLGGRSGYIDAMTMSDYYMPPQMGVIENLSEMGRSAWEATKSLVANLSSSVSKLIDVRQHMLQQGQMQDDTSVYALTSFEQVLDAGALMREYVMAHPGIRQAYDQGIDVYPGMLMSRECHVLFARATDGVVQFDDPDEEYFWETVDVGYEDVHQPSDRDIVSLDHTYRFMQEHICRQLQSLIFDEETE